MHMVFFVTKFLNFFPVKGGISDQYSLKAIMSGEVINYRQYCLPFGSYCQVHKEDLPCNSMEVRTQGAISLGPSSNRQGAQKIYTLTTGKVIVRRSLDVIPMSDGVILRVNKLGADQPQLLTFYDQLNQEIRDEDATELREDIPAEDMLGVIETNELQAQENTVEVEDNIEITGVDDPVLGDYEFEAPKNDLEIDPPTSQPTIQPTIESIDESVPTFEAPNKPHEPVNTPIKQE